MRGRALTLVVILGGMAVSAYVVWHELIFSRMGANP